LDKQWSNERDCYAYRWRATGRNKRLEVEEYTQLEAAQAFKAKFGFEPTTVVTTALISAI
jgi:hypothetical protein